MEPIIIIISSISSSSSSGIIIIMSSNSSSSSSIYLQNTLALCTVKSLIINLWTLKKIKNKTIYSIWSFVKLPQSQAFA